MKAGTGNDSGIDLRRVADAMLARGFGQLLAAEALDDGPLTARSRRYSRCSNPASSGPASAGAPEK